MEDVESLREKKTEGKREAWAIARRSLPVSAEKRNVVFDFPAISLDYRCLSGEDAKCL